MSSQFLYVSSGVGYQYRLFINLVIMLYLIIHKVITGLTREKHFRRSRQEKISGGIKDKIYECLLKETDLVIKKV